MVAHGQFAWNELNTRDIERAKAFYGTTLGWTFNAMPMPDGTYWMAMAGEIPAGGLFDISVPMFDGMPEHWFAYIEVDDVDKRVAGVEAAGGQIMRPAWDVPTVGRIAIVKDSGGAVMGWMTSVQR
jgi:predicted enzyme related to lactoylglutathione lyase